MPESKAPLRLFGIVPAAGLSRRMGKPKLVMDLLGKPVIQHLLEALDFPEIATTAVVMRHSDTILQQTVAALGAVTVLPASDPPDMRTSVEHGIRTIEKNFSPKPDDGWVLIPADHPVLDKSVVRHLIDSWSKTHTDVLIPSHNGRRGHPTILRWKLTPEIWTIPDDQGINWLLKQPHISVEETEVGSDSVLWDLDTPSDFDAIKQKLSNLN